MNDKNVEYHHRKRERDRDFDDCREWICPYFKKDRGGGVIYCECATLRFPDRNARREVVYTYCAHPDGYNKCVLKQVMDRYYERKYSNGGE